MTHGETIAAVVLITFFVVIASLAVYGMIMHDIDCEKERRRKIMSHFRDGNKYDDRGARIPPRHIYEALSSNRHTVYTATLWDDGSTSCNCPGWANRKECKHTKIAVTLTADRSDVPDQAARSRAVGTPARPPAVRSRGIDLE